jgi:hypothetical protein
MSSNTLLWQSAGDAACYLRNHPKGSADAVEAGLGGFLEGVLPDANDFPSLPAELAVDAFIAGHVVCSFFIPECTVGFRAGVALRAAVPETSVDEDGDLLFGERKVRLSRQGKMPSPAGNLLALEERQQCLFGLLVPLPSDEGHYLGALLWCPDVHGDWY